MKITLTDFKGHSIELNIETYLLNICKWYIAVDTVRGNNIFPIIRVHMKSFSSFKSELFALSIFLSEISMQFLYLLMSVFYR